MQHTIVCAWLYYVHDCRNIYHLVCFTVYIAPRFEHLLYTVVESESEVEVCIQFNAETTTVVESRIATIEGSAKGTHATT